MRTTLLSLALLLSVSLGAGRLLAQQSRLAAGAGLLVADKGPSGLLRSRGVTAFVRITPPRLPLILELSLQHVPQTRDILFSPCLPPGTCGSTFLGPTTALTFAPALQASQRVPNATWLLRLGPAFHWLLDRESTSGPIAAGARAGVSVRSGRGRSGLLVSADYFRAFRGSHFPRWFLPLTVGWQF